MPVSKTKPARKAPKKKNPGCASGASAKKKPARRIDKLPVISGEEMSTLAKAASKTSPASPVIFNAPAGLKPHPAANMLPPMDDEEYAALKARISTEGVLEPIKLIIVHSANGMDVQQILDGRHRYKICGELGIDCPAMVYSGSVPPYTYVASVAHHRNMDANQKACAAVDLLPQLEGEAKTRMLAGKPSAIVREGMTRDQWEAHLATISQKERQSLFIKYARPSKRRVDEIDEFDLTWGILDGLFPPGFTPTGKATEHAAALFGCGARYVEIAKSLKAADPDLFNQCFTGKDKEGRPLTLARAIAKVNRDKKAANQKETLELIRKSGIKTDWQIITGDCREELPKLGRRLARLVFADIPYNEGFDYGPGYNDSLPEDEYLDLCEQWIDAAVPLVTEDGAIAIMCSGRYSDHIGYFLRNHDLHRFNTIAWVETFGSYTDNNWTNCWRPIHIYSRQPKPLFNSFAVRVKSWRNENGDPRGVPGGKVPSNVWDFPRITGNSAERVVGDHPMLKDGFPTQLPAALVERLVLTLTEPGDLVIDFCSGSGTTGVAAVMNTRRYIGIELQPVYADASRHRLEAAIPALKSR